MIKRESSFGLLFRHWVMANPDILFTCTFELKQTTTDSISFNCLEEHQIDASMTIKWFKKGVVFHV